MMKTTILKLSIQVFSGILLLAGCSKLPETELPFLNKEGALTVHLQPDGMTVSQRSDRSGTAPTDDSAIEQVTAYRFSQGLFREAVSGEQLGADGTYTFYLKELSGELYFLANGRTELFSELQPGLSSLDDFLSLHASTADMTDRRFLMSGRMDLQEASSSLQTVRLRRSVARLDIASEDRGVEVHSVVIRGIADRGYLNERQEVSTPADAGKSDFQKAYSEMPLENSRETLLYLCEQAGSAISVEVTARFGGGLHRMTATLPAQILRNRIYTIQVHGEGAKASVTIDSEGWEEGSQADAIPTLKGLIDVEASTLPEGVRVNAAQDSVYVAYRGGEFRLVLRAEANSEIEVEGLVRGVTTQSTPLTKALQPVAAVSVTSDRRIPDEDQAYLYLNVRQGQVYSGRIVLVFEPNPVRITGLISLDENRICDFGRYLDGELGRITLPDGKIARLEFESDEDPWMNLVEENGEFRILGGWKPNDPKADGRTQEGRLVISDADGSDVESYRIRRRNWGLPVVKIGQRWWCKYNLRGNVKEFGDQISIQDDPATADGLADYLGRCSDDELLRLMGDQYQGGNQQGLPLRHNGTAFYYEGMKGSGQNFGTLDPTQMAPDGYQIPDYDDYVFFSASNNYNIGGIGTRNYKNTAGDEISVRIQERDATLLGHSYGIVSFYEFRSGEGCWVLYGLGHQWDTTPGNIARMMLLLATHGNSANSWVMEGYAQNDRPGQNWLKFMNQNSTKTRVIRCVKSPVEYIYE